MGEKIRSLGIGRVLLIVLVVGAALAGYVYREQLVIRLRAAGLPIGPTSTPVSGSGVTSTGNTISASGVIQARRIDVASEFGGLVAVVPVREGEDVAADEVVVQFDTALLDTQIDVAQAMVAAAEAGLQQARAGARPGQIAVAEAQLAQAQAGYLAAQTAVTDTQALVDDPQDLNLEIAVTRQQLAAAGFRESGATAQKDAIEVAKGALDDAYARFDGGGRQKFQVSSGRVSDLIIDALPQDIRDALPPDFGQNLPHIQDQTFTYKDYELHVHDGQYELYVWKNIAFPLDAMLLPNTWWQAWVGVNAAAAQTEGVQAKLSHLYAERSNPQAMQAKLNEALGLAQQLEVQVRLAEIQLAGLRSGLSPEQLAVVETQVGQAHAGLTALLKQRDMLTITTPISGTVVQLLVQPGEVAAKGAPLVTVADLSDMTLRVYLPETLIGNIELDQNAEIRVDSFPEQVFGGRVSFISDQAEFTPRNVATQQERQNLVFAVDIQLDNSGGLLKPGMPADVALITAAPTQ